MKVKKLMQTEVGAVSQDAPITEAARIMWDRDCGSVPVVESGKLVGLVTDRDIAMAGLMSGLPLGLVHVREVMSEDIACCDPDDELSAAHAIMRDFQVRRVPVIDEEENLLGILSLNDLVNEAFEGRSKAQQKRQRDTAKTLAEISRRREGSEAMDEDRPEAE